MTPPRRRFFELAGAFLLGVVVALAVVRPAQAGKGGSCHPAWKCPPPTSQPSVVATTASPSSAYTFDDEFDGTALSPVWQRHYNCCGVLAGYDPALATVANGMLSLSVENRSGSWWGYLVDTKTTFTQTYGYFEARIQIPKGQGLWPAWWHYLGTFGNETSELDTMEVCANPPGTNGGNDVTLLHTTVHFANGGQQGYATRTADLSTAPHVYAEDWRADHVSFFLDGNQVARFTDAANIPSTPMALLLNLGVGGSWCGAPGSGTPSPSTMLIDWVRVRA